jgi:hypothetical protein
MYPVISGRIVDRHLDIEHRTLSQDYKDQRYVLRVRPEAYRYSFCMLIYSIERLLELVSRGNVMAIFCQIITSKTIP